MAPSSTYARTDRSIQVEWAFQMMQVLALGCIKLSFLFFYRRVFVNRSSSWFSKATMAMIVIIVIWTVSFFFALLLACKGNWSAWWGSVVDLATKCVQTLQLELALVTSDFITDVLIMILPIPMVNSPDPANILRVDHIDLGPSHAHRSEDRSYRGLSPRSCVSKLSVLVCLSLTSTRSIAASIVRMNQFIQVIQGRSRSHHVI